MALVDQLLFGTYVGLVIDVQDPDGLGRAKILIPGKLGTLYSGWNESEEDIKFSSVTSNVFNQEKLSRLKKVLPWARPAMPIFGGATGSFNQTSTGTPFASPTEAAFMGGGSGGSVGLNGTNGRLDVNNTNQLVALPGFSGHYAHPIVAGKFQELIAAAKADGINLGIVDSYRTYDEQVYLYNTKGPGYAARPGNSNHGWGLAFDFKGINGTSTADAYAWLRNNASNYGWSNFVGGYGPDTRGEGGSQKEPWHWQINKSDLGKYTNYSLLGGSGDDGGGGVLLGGSIDNRETSNDGINNHNADFTQKKDVSSGNSQCTSNFGIGLSESRAKAAELNQIMDASGARINVVNGVMDEQSAKAYFVQRLKNSPLLCADIDPAEANAYGMSNTKDPNEWADFIWRTALAEHGGKVTATGSDVVNDPNGSYGAFSNSASGPNGSVFNGNSSQAGDAYQYAGYTDVSSQVLQSNPEIASNVMISLLERQVGKGNRISDIDIRNGGSFASNTTARLRGEGAPLGKASSGRLVQRITNQGVNAYGSINGSRFGMPVGSFSSPAVGSKVYVMFENGSPQRPIYFAMAYDPSNIRSYDGQI